MGSIPVEQAMLAIQQAKVAIQQGLKRTDSEQFSAVEKQLQQALQIIDDAKQKSSANEGQLLEQANVAVLDTIEQLQQTKLPPNLQNG
ncbi:hypothetical protein DS745_15835 [Anaerobacillus alkaliphilus]|uniref:DUF2564 family protein n=1 Tax=Anaerobacillus alkaliphilus TaxID=1548597 RepID=A0A4Q0VP62_9BACI|nr:hypothetical protein [Anaerobacillus alkaliphilus]RXI97831.1 hypothetical protein DS745_15835 [Anaerobacillus alkaliphilus]